MTDRVWSAMFTETGDGRWQMARPRPATEEVAAAQGVVLARAIADHPDRLVFSVMPPDETALGIQVLRASGLEPLARSIWVRRPPSPPEVLPWPEGVRVHTAAEVGYAPFAALLSRVQSASDDWPEFQGWCTPEVHIATMAGLRGHRPDWWFAVEVDGEPGGMLLLDERGDDAIEYSFAGVVPELRARRLAGRWFRSVVAQLPPKPIVGAIDERNTRSRAMVRALGFVEDGYEIVWIRSPRARGLPG